MEKRETQMINELCEVDEGLDDHEVRFIEDLSHRPGTYKLSERQLAWLERLWTKHCLKGC